MKPVAVTLLFYAIVIFRAELSRDHVRLFVQQIGIECRS